MSSKSSVARNGTGASAPDERLAHRGPVQQLLTRPEIGALLGAAGVWILFWLVSEAFGTAGGTASFLDVAALLGVMAVPVALLMVGGEFDLSSGSMTGATAVMVILLSKEVGDLGGAGLTLHIAVPLSLAFALGIGWFNGTLVQKTSLPSFIVTLGTYFMLVGAKLSFAKLFTNKVIVPDLNEAQAYATWDDLFGAEWIRNRHIFDARDLFWAALLIGGGSILLAALFELSYKRNSTTNPGGVLACLVGVGVEAVGFIGLLYTDGVASNWLFGAMIAVGALLSVAGWCRARYERPVGSLHFGLSGVAQSQRASVSLLVGGGIAAIAVAMLAALALDDSNSDRLNFLGGAYGRGVLAVGIAAVGVLGVLAAMGRVSAGTPAIGAAIVAFPTVSYMVTVQGARAMLFGGLGMAGVLAISVAAARTRRDVLLPLLTSVAVVVLAFFIQSQASSRKLRVELFTALMLVALLLAAFALARLLSVRRTVAPPPPGLGLWVKAAGVLGAASALVFAVVEWTNARWFGAGSVPVAVADDPEREVSVLGEALHGFTTGVVKGVLVGLSVYAVGTLWRMFFSRDEGCGRSLVGIGLAAVGVAIAMRLLFITTVEEAATEATTRFRVAILFYLLAAAVGAWVLARTRFGSWTFAVGGNKDASRSVGVPVDRTKTTLFMLVSGSAWLAGMLLAFRLDSVQADVGDTREFVYIIIAVVGGNLLTGGYGSAIGAAIGALIWGMITSGISFARWNTDWRFLVLGGLLLIAVIINNFVRGRAERSLPSADDDEPDGEPPPNGRASPGDAVAEASEEAASNKAEALPETAS